MPLQLFAITMAVLPREKEEKKKDFAESGGGRGRRDALGRST